MSKGVKEKLLHSVSSESEPEASFTPPKQKEAVSSSPSAAAGKKLQPWQAVAAVKK